MQVFGRSPVARRGVLTVILAVAASGCGGGEIDPVTSKKLKAVAELYCHYAFEHANAGPGDEQALRKHAQKMDWRTAKSMGVDVDKLDELFTSPRDQKPFTVMYGQPVTNLGQKAPMIAHEQVGIKGKRYAVYGNGRIEALGESGPAAP